MYKMYKRIAHETIAETKYWDNEFQLYTIIEYQLHHIFTSIELMKHYFTRFKKKKNPFAHMFNIGCIKRKMKSNLNYQYRYYHTRSSYVDNCCTF
jgi:hypothetical protein